MNDFLRRRITGQPDNAWVQALWGVGLAGAAVLLRQALTPLVQTHVPFITFFPAVLAASILAGPRGGAVCVVACLALAFVASRLTETLSPLDNRGWVAAVLFAASGAVIVWMAGVLRAALAEVSQAREQEQLITGELQHRVKNTLAIVQALAAQTLQAAPDLAGFKRAFTERLVALAQAHSLLSDSTWGPVPITAAVKGTLAPFISAGDSLSVQGEEVTLAPDQVVSLALCLHELATNATKYGALSVPHGRVRIAWEVRAEETRRRVRLTWTEFGGPAVAAPTHKGFGSRLLSRGFASNSRARVRLSFPAEGAVWSAEFDLVGASAS